MASKGPDGKTTDAFRTKSFGVVADALNVASATDGIIVIVEGGIVQHVVKPESLGQYHVEVRDYGIDGVPEAQLTRDGDGNLYQRATIKRGSLPWQTPSSQGSGIVS